MPNHQQTNTFRRAYVSVKLGWRDFRKTSWAATIHMRSGGLGLETGGISDHMAIGASNDIAFVEYKNSEGDIVQMDPFAEQPPVFRVPYRSGRCG